MNRIFLLITLLYLVSCNSEPENNQTKDTTINQNNYSKDSIISRGTFLTDKELEYIKTSDRYIEYFKHPTHNDFKIPIDQQEKDSLMALERLMKEILKDAHFIDGQINLETLFEEEGFGRIDGLNMSKDSLNVFYTTKNLFFYYFMNDTINFLNQLNSRDLEKIFNGAFMTDAAIYNLTSLKFNTKSNIRAYGMAGVETNGDVVEPPNYIYVFLADDKYVYMVQKGINVKLTEIKECKAIYDSLISLNGDISDVEQRAWNKHCECYQQKFKNESQYDYIKKQMEYIEKYLEH